MLLVNFFLLEFFAVAAAAAAAVAVALFLADAVLALSQISSRFSPRLSGRFGRSSADT